MGTGSETKIDTKLFENVADQFASITKSLQNQCRDWQKIVSGLRGEWQGDTSDDIKNTAAQIQKSSDALLTALAGYEKALKQIAGIYVKTEAAIQNESKTLKFNGANFK